MTKSEYIKEWYKKNSKKFAAWKKWHKEYRKGKPWRAKGIKAMATKRQTILKRYNKAKAESCLDCGIEYSPWIMQFDHRPDEQKIANVCKIAYSTLDIKKLNAEINKCNILCANCHANRTYLRRLGDN